MYYATHFSVATAQGIPAAQVFIEKFRAAYNKDPDFVGAEAYDAATATFVERVLISGSKVSPCAPTNKIKYLRHRAVN